MDSGSWADWIGAVGTTAGTLVVGFGLLHEIRLRRCAEQQAEAERHDAEGRYARLVSVNVLARVGAPTQVEITNDGDGPIRHVTIDMTLHDPGPPFYAKMLHPGQRPNSWECHTKRQDDDRRPRVGEDFRR